MASPNVRVDSVPSSSVRDAAGGEQIAGTRAIDFSQKQWPYSASVSQSELDVRRGGLSGIKPLSTAAKHPAWQGITMKMDSAKAWDTAFLCYADRLKAIVAGYPNADLLELGAGRYPSFRINDMPETVGSYTVNDISAEELLLLPAGYDKACFDVGGDASNFSDTYDVVFSRFLAEHVPDGIQMHKNVFQVLKDGGTAFHLIPTLYALPFLLNKYLPEALARKLLKTLSPRRNISPKFAAYYSACYGSPKKMSRLLREIGYSEIEVHPFYGHFYYEKIFGLKHAHEQFSAIAANRNWNSLASYAYIRAVK